MGETEAVLALVLMLGGFGTIAMMIWAFVRTRRPPSSAAPDHVARLAAQMEALQGSIDAMALEVERIGEGQRFTTKLLSEREAARADPSLRSG